LPVDSTLHCSAKYVIATHKGKASIWGEHWASDKQSYSIIPHPVLMAVPQVFKVACGFDHTLLLTSEGVFAWGSNSQGQLGLSSRKLIKSPFKLDTEASDIAAGVRTSFMVTSNGVLACGFNKDRALGCARTESSVSKPIPVKLESLSQVISIKTGFKHTVIQCEDGSVYCAGSNQKGQLG
jgi:alpha-tubulin suppressor-like RCC1 family protein